MKRRDCRALSSGQAGRLSYRRARNDTAPPPRLPHQGGGYKRGFTLIEMLTTTAILVVVFALLAIIFARATNIHKIVRSGGDAENLGVYLINTIVYGPGIDREKGLSGAQSVTSLTGGCSPTVLYFIDKNNQEVQYTLGDAVNTLGVTIDGNTLCYGPLTCPPGVDLKPSWAVDRQLEVLLPESKFSYYKDDFVTDADGSDTAAVGIKLVIKNTLQNIEEAVTLYRCVRVRNQIDF